MKDATTSSPADETDDTLDEKNPRDRQGFEEIPAPQGLKTPPAIPFGDDSGEWTRGGGADPNEIKRQP